MKEFFLNMYTWFVINKDSIIATLMSSTTLGFLTSIVLLIKQIKSSKNNTQATNTLNESIKSNETLCNTTNDTNSEVKKLREENSELKKIVTNYQKERKDFEDAVFTKLNAMMDVQSIVYSTVKDDTIRNNVQNLLVSAKYSETKTRAELEAEVEALKNVISTKLADVQNTIDKTVENVKKTVTPTTDKETEETELVRY